MNSAGGIVNKTYALISRISPIVYLIIYILLTPIFALAYTFTPGQAFFAPYAKYEPRATTDVYSLEYRLRQQFADRLREERWLPGHWRVENPLPNLGMKPGPEPDQITLKIVLNLTRETARGREDYDNIPFTTIVSFQPILAFSLPDQICRPVVLVENDKLVGIDSKRIFHALFHGKGRCLGGDFLSLDKYDNTLLYRLYGGFFGDAKAFTGTYWRMLYFSATTVTTVGFGDIVPVTDAARATVALEALLGMIVSGLFLNSVAWRITRLPVQA